ncbi:HAD-IIA family hydrolase [Halomicrobium salinisoli]|uniref:HAD-IIA family hydrolase n=1 Tax=Halomicrobium salinisoli TaxID=2878391 RepID=UPI001CF0518D|nr:HAD-IIA family hydrolase [Halomicrobium salinisoli]
MVEAAIVDLDGTVYHGDDPLPGASEGIDALRAAGASLLFFSNNPVYDGEDYVERLQGMGLDVRQGEAVSAADVTREYLVERHPGDDIFLVGTDALADMLRTADLTLTDEPEAADVLLASWTPEFGYDDLVDALRVADGDGTVLLGTDPDRTFPGSEGKPIPGSGAVINAVAGVLEREPDRVLGKPSAEATATALERLGVPAEDVLVVGDRLDTDVAMGERAGMETAVVLTGVTDRAAVEASDVSPDHVLDSLAEVGRLVN